MNTTRMGKSARLPQAGQQALHTQALDRSERGRQIGLQNGRGNRQKDTAFSHGFRGLTRMADFPHPCPSAVDISAPILAAAGSFLGCGAGACRGKAGVPDAAEGYLNPVKVREGEIKLS